MRDHPCAAAAGLCLLQPCPQEFEPPFAAAPRCRHEWEEAAGVEGGGRTEVGRSGLSGCRRRRGRCCRCGRCCRRRRRCRRCRCRCRRYRRCRCCRCSCRRWSALVLLKGASPEGQALLQQEELVVEGGIEEELGHAARLLQLAPHWAGTGGGGGGGGQTVEATRRGHGGRVGGQLRQRVEGTEGGLAGS